MDDKFDRFLFSYDGNKYKETKKYLIPEFNINKYQYDIVAELFCGIFCHVL